MLDVFEFGKVLENEKHLSTSFHIFNLVLKDGNISSKLLLHPSLRHGGECFRELSVPNYHQLTVMVALVSGVTISSKEEVGLFLFCWLGVR
jgi:hypothetical protein